jgi:RND family efflux transporter MFP subunit
MTQKNRSLFKGLLSLGLILGACLALYSQWGAVKEWVQEDNGPKKGRAGGGLARVLVKPVTLTSDDRNFEVIGTGRARLSAEIYPEVSENVTEVLFKPGQRVSKGDTLVRLDARPERLGIRLARVRLAQAQSLLDRYKQSLGAHGGVSLLERDQAQSALDAATVELAQQRLALDLRTVRAPFDGVISLSQVDPGDRASPTTLIATVDDRSALFVDFEVPEALAGDLLQGRQESLELSTPSRPGETFQGQVLTSDSRLDASRRSLLVRAQVDNAQDKLRPGMSFTVRWRRQGPRLPTIPEIALQWAREGAYAWVIREDKSYKVQLEVVSRRQGKVLVKGDLKEGDQVVVEGVQRLRPEAPVQVLQVEQRGA